MSRIRGFAWHAAFFSLILGETFVAVWAILGSWMRRSESELNGGAEPWLAASFRRTRSSTKSTRFSGTMRRQVSA